MAKKKTGNIQKRGENSYRIMYYSDGVRQAETIRGGLEEAQKQLNIRLGEISRGLPVTSKAHTVRFDELAADVVNDYKVNNYDSVDDVETRYRLHILPFFGRRRAVSITTANIKAYIVKRQNDVPKPKTGTINRELEAISRAFNLAMEERRIMTKPHIPKTTENNVRTGFFTREDVLRLMPFFTPEVGRYVMFGFLTGWRYGEIRTLEWRHVDFEAGEIRLDPGSTKNGDGRVFPMNAELRTLLVAAYDARSPFCPFVFTSRKKQVGKEGSGFRRQWQTANRKAGMPCIVDINGKFIKAQRIFHDLRRSAARNLQQQGFTEGQIMLLMGHRTRSMFDRYQIVTMDDIRETMRRLDSANAAQNPNEGSNGANFSTNTLKFRRGGSATD